MKDPSTLVILIPVFFTSLTTCVLSIINAIRGKAIQTQVTPPSNGQTLGEAMERISPSPSSILGRLPTDVVRKVAPLHAMSLGEVMQAPNVTTQGPDNG